MILTKESISVEAALSPATRPFTSSRLRQVVEEMTRLQGLSTLPSIITTAAARLPLQPFYPAQFGLPLMSWAVETPIPVATASNTGFIGTNLPSSAGGSISAYLIINPGADALTGFSYRMKKGVREELETFMDGFDSFADASEFASFIATFFIHNDINVEASSAAIYIPHRAAVATKVSATADREESGLNAHPAVSSLFGATTGVVFSTGTSQFEVITPDDFGCLHCSTSSNECIDEKVAAFVQANAEVFSTPNLPADPEEQVCYCPDECGLAEGPRYYQVSHAALFIPIAHDVLL